MVKAFRRTNVSLVVVALSAGTTLASAHDLNPAPFRGQPGSTYSAWDFVTPAQGAPDGPCQPQNPIGVPEFSSSPGNIYFPNFAGEQGVWCISAPGKALTFKQPCGGGPPFFLKTIFVQMTLHLHSTTAGIEVHVDPPGGIAMQSGPTIDLPVPGKGPQWVHRTVAVCIFQCPPEVKVSLVCTGLPTDHVDVSEVVIETKCEPDLCHEPHLPIAPGDYDGDGVTDTWDNAPGVANPNQSDCNGNGIGDVSDSCEICPPGTPQEPEPCGADLNGGCNDPNDPVTQLSCNDQFCGTLWAKGGNRDTDWYEIFLPDNDGDGKADLFIEVCTALPTLVFVLSNDCTQLIGFGIFDADLDRPGSITLCLPGNEKYRIVLTTGSLAGGGIFDGYPCGGFHNEYWLRAWCSEPCFVCGLNGGNECCSPTQNNTAGCEDGACCAKVCAVDPFCCNVLWDAVCAQEARALCNDLCCRADINNDGIVNGVDLAIVLGFWGVNYANPADLNGDCVVNGVDLAIVLGQWGPC